MSERRPTPSRERLDSWKAIAAFLGRDERTVNRWEKELGLPVHRLPGTKGRVYAYIDELTRWLAASECPAAFHAHSPNREPNQTSVEFGVVVEGSKGSGSEPLSRSSVEEVNSRSGWAYSGRTWLLATTILALGLTAIAYIFFHVRASGSDASDQTASLPRQTSVGGVPQVLTASHDPEAEKLYLQGRYYWNKRSPEDLSRGLDYFTQSIARDPNFSQAYVGLADSYNLLREYTTMPASEAYPRALAAAKKAVELDDQSSEAHASLAFASFFGVWDISGGVREFRRAIELNPQNAAAHHWYGNALLALNRLPEALAENDRAQSLNPASSAILADKGNILLTAGQRDEALSLLRQMESGEPSFRSVHVYLRYLYWRCHDYPNFLTELQHEALLAHDDSTLAITRAGERGLASGGARGMLQAMLHVQLTLYSQHSFPPTSIAQTFAVLGKKSEAVKYLRAAFEQHDELLLYVETYPEFDLLQDEPTYRDLLANMMLPVQSLPSLTSASALQERL